MCVELKRRRFERVWAVGLAPGSERETKGDSAASEAALNASATATATVFSSWPTTKEKTQANRRNLSQLAQRSDHVVHVRVPLACPRRGLFGEVARDGHLEVVAVVTRREQPVRRRDEILIAVSERATGQGRG